MSGVGTHETAAKARTPQGRTASLRAELAHDYAATYGRDPRYDCLDGLERLVRWIRSLPTSERRVVRRSVPQICRALDLPYDGTVKDARMRHRSSLKRRLGYLVEMGWVLAWRPLYAPNGEGECWEITLDSRATRGCSSVGSSISRRGAHKRRSLFFSGQVAPPSREPTPQSDVAVAFDGREVSTEPTANGGASARVVRGDREAYERWSVHAARRRAVVAAMARASLLSTSYGIEGAGAALVGSDCVAAAPVSDLARALFRMALPDVAPRLSLKRRRQLEAGAMRIDRYSGQSGAWVQYATGVLAEWADGQPGKWTSEPPRSLGALALELRREGNVRRLRDLERRRERLRPLAAYRRRSEIKDWRAKRRRGEATWYPPRGRDA